MAPSASLSNASVSEPAPPRREQILHAAAEAFAARGFRGATTREIAARVGITEAALYRHFPSKEAIYAAILDTKIAAPSLFESGPVAEAVQRSDDAGVFRGLAQAILSSVERDPFFVRILFYTALEGHALAEPFFATRVRRLRERLTEYIARRTQEGAFRAVDPMLSARAFLGMVLDFVIVRDVFGQREAYPHTSEEAGDGFVAVFLEGIRAREDRHVG